VLHELGQPLHAFDLDATGATVVVRRARPGEMLVTLDGERRALTPEILLIADALRPIALAGIMGGADTEVRDTTEHILLECALFEPKRIRLGRRALDLITDASYRFERGVDPDAMERAVRRATELILTTAGGRVEPRAPLVDAGIEPSPAVFVRAQRVAHVLGMPVERDEIAELLRPLGFMVELSRDEIAVRVPGHRRYDVSREEDIIEEIARRKGYDVFPDDIRPFRPSVVPDDAMAGLEERLRTLFVARGFLEARSAPLAAEADGDVALLHPLSAAESRLRRALVPGLLRRLEANFNRGTRDVRLFEIGTVFAPGASGVPVEATHVAMVFSGARGPQHWTGASAALDRWDLRGLLEEVAALLEAGVELVLQPAESWLAPDDALEVVSHADPERRIGRGGAVRGDAIDAPAWAGAVFAAEIALNEAMAQPWAMTFRPLPSQPPVDRDLALVVPDAVSAMTVEAGIRNAVGALLEFVEPFDVYAGAGIPAGTRSIAFRLRFRAPDRTLTDDEVDRAMEMILLRLREEHHVERR
jgi:phenylalanyl-tRNA synthetase beta chain